MKEPFYIHLSKISGHHSMPSNHFHEPYEIYYLLSGERNYFIKDNTYRISKGDIVFIDKNELHKTGDAGVPNHERILINFSERFLHKFDEPLLFEPFRRKIRRLRLNLPEREWMERLLFEMLQEDREELLGSDASLAARLVTLLLWCGRRLDRQEQEQAPYEHESPAHKKISEIVEYINGAYEAPLSLESVAKSHYVSPFHLSRMFKKVTGFSFVEYVNTVRVREAQRLLKETEWKVTRISETVGYENLGHFGRVFKQLTKTNPLDYRKSAKRADGK
ncbi:helix-turn-helix transcriptional regulator [Paenibacillus mesophilus]|uniref:helix-turn-helix transcriptional regulator n=1 Tax=Paenibacillus mesophilus TaxID=2582849 RepID=UPI001EE4BF95|nr:AraC family transcriptional regulator [Paenibacillus mesophilus]